MDNSYEVYKVMSSSDLARHIQDARDAFDYGKAEALVAIFNERFISDISGTSLYISPHQKQSDEAVQQEQKKADTLPSLEEVVRKEMEEKKYYTTTNPQGEIIAMQDKTNTIHSSQQTDISATQTGSYLRLLEYLTRYSKELQDLIQSYIEGIASEFAIPQTILTESFISSFDGFIAKKTQEEPMLQKFSEEKRIRSILLRYREEFAKLIT